MADLAADAGDEVSWREVRRVLDEEVSRLPERLRLPIFLCYFEGKTRDEAAEALGWKLRHSAWTAGRRPATVAQFVWPKGESSCRRRSWPFPRPATVRLSPMR